MSRNTPTPTPTRTPYASPPSTPATASRPDQFLVTLDPDLLPACEDQAQAMALTLGTWVQQAANDAIRQMLGV